MNTAICIGDCFENASEMIRTNTHGEKYGFCERCAILHKKRTLPQGVVCDFCGVSLTKKTLGTCHIGHSSDIYVCTKCCYEHHVSEIIEEILIVHTEA